MGEKKLRKRRPPWLRVLRVTVVVVLLLAAAWGGLWLYANAKLNAELAAIAARGG